MLTYLLEVNLLPVYPFEELMLLHLCRSAREKHKWRISNSGCFQMHTLDGGVWCITSLWQAFAALLTQMTCKKGTSSTRKLTASDDVDDVKITQCRSDVSQTQSPSVLLLNEYNWQSTPAATSICANVVINCVLRDRNCGACTVPLALTAEPLGNISLQQPLQQIFKLCSERVWQLHVLQGVQKKRGGQRGQFKDMTALISSLKHL